MAVMVGFPTDGDDGSVASEARWRQMARLWAPSGVVAGYLGDLVPSLAAGTITVQAGAAWVDGHYAEATGTSTFTATVTGLVVVRFTPADNTFEMLYRDGATTPTQTTATWELPIARVTASVLYDVRTVIPVGGSTTTQIGHTVLAANAATVDFPDIPQTFNHLRLVANLRGTDAAQSVECWLRANGDNTTQYHLQTVRGNGATASGVSRPGEVGVRLTIPAAGSFSTNAAAVTVDIPTYRHGSFRRGFLISNGLNRLASSGPATDMFIDQSFASWITTAITRLTLTPNSGSLATGSMVSLYGLM